MPTVALIGPELSPIPPLRGGATEQFIYQLAGRLTRWQPVVIGVGDPELPQHEIRGQVEYYRVPLVGWRQRLYKRYRRFFPYYDRRVLGIIQKVKPALIHVHNRPLLALSLKRWLPHLPLILHMHNLYNILGKRERPAPGTPIPVEGFVACSRFVLEQETHRLASGAASRFVLYNGVDPVAFSPWWDRESLRMEVRRQHGLIDEPTVLFVGKLRQSKGVGVLLAAMDLVWRQVPRAVLVLVGGTEFGHGRLHRQTPFLEELKKPLAAAAGRVILTGFIPPPEVPRAYLLGDLFAAPSQIPEGLPLVLLEALASGLPVITTRMGGIPEVIREGLNGLLLDRKDDTLELADKIIRLLTDARERETLGRQGQEWVGRHFSWEQIARQQEEIFDEVLKASASRTSALYAKN